MADVERHAALDGATRLGAHAAVRIEDTLLASVEAVGEDVAGPQLAQDVVERDRGVADVDHQRQPRRLGRLARGQERDPCVGAGLLTREPHFHAADEVTVRLDRPESLRPIDEPDVLELTDLGAQHPRGADVQERQNPRLGDLDHILAEGREGEGAGGARVHDRGRPRPEAVGVGLDAVVRGAGEDVDVEIDEAGRDEEAPRVHDLLAAGAPRPLGDGGDTATRDRDVPLGVEPLRGVDNRAATNQHAWRPVAA